MFSLTNFGYSRLAGNVWFFLKISRETEQLNALRLKNRASYKTEGGEFSKRSFVFRGEPQGSPPRTSFPRSNPEEFVRTMQTRPQSSLMTFAGRIYVCIRGTQKVNINSTEHLVRLISAASSHWCLEASKPAVAIALCESKAPDRPWSFSLSPPPFPSFTCSLVRNSFESGTGSREPGDAH